MTKPLTELFDEMVSFKSLENYWNVPSFIVGSQDETNCGDPIHLATKGLIEALEFYGERNNWVDRSPYVSCEVIFVPNDSTGFGPCGDRARQALAEFRASLEDGE